MKLNYAESFYDAMVDPSTISAEIIVPLILRLVPAQSVVDVGCGEGRWLSVFKKNGLGKIYGIDGTWVKPERLAIPTESFQSTNLDEPFKIDFVADLAVSLEVAEHLLPASADGFIASLVAIAPVIIFSAAIPLQGGSRHLNEQWPAYWEEKFSAHGYVPVDPIRRHIWGDSRVSFFYSQNILVYVKKDALDKYPLLVAEIASGHDKSLPLVHPFIFNYYAERWRMLVPYLGLLPVPLLHAVKRAISYLRRR